MAKIELDLAGVLNYLAGTTFPAASAGVALLVLLGA